MLSQDIPSYGKELREYASEFSKTFRCKIAFKRQKSPDYNLLVIEFDDQISTELTNCLLKPSTWHGLIIKIDKNNIKKYVVSNEHPQSREPVEAFLLGYLREVNFKFNQISNNELPNKA